MRVKRSSSSGRGTSTSSDAASRVASIKEGRKFHKKLSRQCDIDFLNLSEAVAHAAGVRQLPAQTEQQAWHVVDKVNVAKRCDFLGRGLAIDDLVSCDDADSGWCRGVVRNVLGGQYQVEWCEVFGGMYIPRLRINYSHPIYKL